MTFLAKAYILTNQVQPYAWGERGPAAFLAQFLNLPNVAQDAPLAELWMGTHPLGTSTLEGELLSALVQRHPTEILGARVAAAFAGQFPFLLKILSANEPLSIQLHPSKAQAVALREKDPAHYPDDNHKPEIAIALERLQALAGLRGTRQVAALMAAYPALAGFVEFAAIATQTKSKQPMLAFQSLLRKAISAPGEMTQVIGQIAAAMQAKSRRSYREKLFLEMNEKYPGDVGLLSILFLKLHNLHKGQAMFIPAGVPHAYLKGNIVECMASSDNVIRGGLTPKFKDIPALIEIVTDQQVMLFTPDAPNYSYDAPVSEFRIHKLALQAGQSTSENSDSVRILLILSGRLKINWPGGTLDVTRGQSVLLPAILSQVEIECVEDAEIYKADVP